MSNNLRLKATFTFAGLLCVLGISAQSVPIQQYSIDSEKLVTIEVNSDTNHYYILESRLDEQSAFDFPASITPGTVGTTRIREMLGALPQSHYRVLEYANNSPHDTDGDGLDDLTEFNDGPRNSPFNAAPAINPADGYTMLTDHALFEQLSAKKEYVQWSEFLNSKVYVKFIIVDFLTDQPKLYFMNSVNHDLHRDFANAIGIASVGEQVKTGQVIYHPGTNAASGQPGVYTFNYSNGYAQSFEVVRKTHEMLAANLPFLRNNLSYFVTSSNEDEYADEKALFDASRVHVLFQADLYTRTNYWGVNPSEGFGLFRLMEPGETPGSKDIVLYESLPNSLPRVGGIMTSVLQTPLSHVNLRAIQSNIPNAYVKDPLSIDSVEELLNEYVYFRVEAADFHIRKASLEEVNDWYEDLRPTQVQIPPLNLEYRDILPLDEINFSMYDGFGAKCANLAQMRRFGMPEGTIPDGFGIPFHFYREFMVYNDFDSRIISMLFKPDFQTDREVRKEMLSELREDIRNAEMPDWMMDELAEMHASFPAGTSVRCRSSSNNEDLPGFNGAGLYTSKTQHPEEGHISKSVKQVYASLWNLRAFEERDFERVDQLQAAMGVLCHPNFDDEKVNGVGVSTDPVYQTEYTFYLNSQLGEDLITNPNSNSIPEEILMDEFYLSENNVIVIQYSDQLPDQSLVMTLDQMDYLREYLSLIHDEFEILYHGEEVADFAMDIEYKITRDDRLVIKQARPWSYGGSEKEEVAQQLDLEMKVYPNPVKDRFKLDCRGCNLDQFRLVDQYGRIIESADLGRVPLSRFEVDVSRLQNGIYTVLATSRLNGRVYRSKFIRQ